MAMIITLEYAYRWQHFCTSAARAFINSISFTCLLTDTAGYRHDPDNRYTTHEFRDYDKLSL